MIPRPCFSYSGTAHFRQGRPLYTSPVADEHFAKLGDMTLARNHKFIPESSNYQHMQDKFITRLHNCATLLANVLTIFRDVSFLQPARKWDSCIEVNIGRTVST